MKSSDLLLHLEAYIALKRAVGFPLGARERLLRDFVAFIEDNGIRGTISAQVALDWACSASDRCGTSRRAARLSLARGFLVHLSAVVPGTEVPSARLLAQPARRKPFLFSDDENKPSAKGRLIIRAASLAATAHDLDVIGVAGQFRTSGQRSLEPYSHGRLAGSDAGVVERGRALVLCLRYGWR
jgi:hypothetical protein